MLTWKINLCLSLQTDKTPLQISRLLAPSEIFLWTTARRKRALHLFHWYQNDNIFHYVVESNDCIWDVPVGKQGTGLRKPA